MVRSKKGRRRVVVAAMIYDQEDRLLVGTDGVLPTSDIIATEERPSRRSLGRSMSPSSWDANSTNSSVLHVDLTPSHPAFIAALRSTWAWRQPGVVPPTTSSGLSVSADDHSQAEEGGRTVEKHVGFDRTAFINHFGYGFGFISFNVWPFAASHAKCE